VREISKRPPHPTLRVDLSPKGEVMCGEIVPQVHLSLGGEVGPKDRVRGPFGDAARSGSEVFHR
jgi:hypothetical protein